MAKYKQGYNAKGRAGSLKKQQELKAAKQKTWVKNPDAEQPEDSNAELMVPKSEAEKEERKRKLKEELTPTETKISSKKRKRLDKYIVSIKKLRKDNRTNSGQTAEARREEGPVFRVCCSKGHL